MSVNIKQNGSLTKISGLYNAYNGAPDYYVEATQTLSTTGDTTFTFTDNKIHTSSAVSPYTSIFGMNPKSMTISEGQCVVVFPPYSEAVAMSCRLYIKSSGTGSNSPTNYSTEKVAVGTWIDGRTIYQQTFVKEITQSGIVTLNSTPTNIDMCIGYQGFYNMRYKLSGSDYSGNLIYFINEESSNSSIAYISSIYFNPNGTSTFNIYAGYPASASYEDLSVYIYFTIQFVEVES